MSIYLYDRNPGLVSESDYPYTSGVSGKRGTCNNDLIKDKNVKKIKATEVEYCEPCTIDQFYTFLSRGPIAVSSYVTDDWYLYTDGIFSVATCNSEKANHAVVAVGWGVESTTEYIIIRNSWGSDWGEKGHMKIKYQPKLKKSCFITLRATRPIF